MTEHAICFKCIDDEVLRATVESDGEPLLCESCGEENNNAFSYERLGEELEPVVREHFQLGPTVRKFYDDDKEGWEQEGESLSDIVQIVLGQDVDDPDALVTALMDAENYCPGDGDDAFYDDTQLYVRRKATPHAWMEKWHYLREELAHRKRFFSDSARILFDELLEGVIDLKFFHEDTDQWLPVVNDLPAGTDVFRARAVRSDSELQVFLEAPPRELSAPPAERASAGRMNATGIAVFYAALDSETCLAEMRPALGDEYWSVDSVRLRHYASSTSAGSKSRDSPNSVTSIQNMQSNGSVPYFCGGCMTLLVARWFLGMRMSTSSRRH